MKVQVVHAEVDTGIIVGIDGNPLIDGTIGAIEFNTTYDAKNYAQNYINDNPNIECAIQDLSGTTIEIMRNEDYIRKKLVVQNNQCGRFKTWLLKMKSRKKSD